MNEESVSRLTAEEDVLLEVGFVLGQNHAFGLVAGRCSAAQAESLLRLRDQRLYKRCAGSWLEFCPRYLKISRTEADRTIKLLEDFGPAYFELSQLTRVSPETYRAIAPDIHDGALHYNGEVIELTTANSPRLAAAVAEMRRALPRPALEPQRLMQELNDICHEADVQQRILKLEQHGHAVVQAFENIAHDERLGMAGRWFFNRSMARLLEELTRVAAENRVEEQ